MLTLTVLSRDYCSLCHEMIEALRLTQMQTPFDLEVIDVDDKPDLEEKYGELVPVLLAGERKICHYRLDNAALNAYLAEIG